MSVRDEDHSKIEDFNDTDSSPIYKFYYNANVFLTGSTGFLGMVILEKLLMSFPDISKIYLLIRAKKGKKAETRLNWLQDDVAFTRVREQDPDFMEKIVLVEGDCESPQLGLSTQDVALLIEEIDIVIHAAATVRFDETLKKATSINVRAVRDILRLAQQMHKLKSFVHISTAYSNCTKDVIEEKIYPPVLEYSKLISLAETTADDILNGITPTLLGKYPNTYTYTKQIGEDAVKQEGKGLPVGIHRPAIVSSSYKEPLPGWVNNIYGPSGLFGGGGVGLIRTLPIRYEMPANMVPVDLVSNSIIATAWDIGENYKKSNHTGDDIPVYNCSSNLGPPLTWGELTKKTQELGWNYVSMKTIWYMYFVGSSNKFEEVIFTFFLHTLPAFLVDAVRFCLRKPPMMLKIYGKISFMISVLAFFMNNGWKFQVENTRKLISKMSEQERKIFYFDYNGFDWKEYMDSYCCGIRLYLFKDPLETLPTARKRGKWLYWLHQLSKVIAVATSMSIIWFVYSLIFKFVN